MINIYKPLHLLLRKWILAWDPDFTKLTIAEASRIKRAEKQIKDGELFTDDDVWNN